MPLMADATSYDYVVIGAGSAGCAAAARLCRAGFTVCLIEAGGEGGRLVSRMPLANALQVPKIPGINNWKHHTTQQA